MDWGILKYLDSKGRDCKIAYYVMVLGYSRMRYAEFNRRCDEASLLRCMVNAFEYFNGVPDTGLTDRIKTVALSSDHGRPVWQTNSERFATEFGFVPKLGRIRRPQIKGRVERLVLLYAKPPNVVIEAPKKQKSFLMIRGLIREAKAKTKKTNLNNNKWRHKMEIAEYTFYPIMGSEDEWEHILYSFLAALYKNGQIISSPNNIGYSEGNYKLYCKVAEPESLHEKYYTDACRDEYKILLEKSREKPRYEIVASAIGALTCNCSKPRCYVLYQPILYESSPVFCGECEAMVPLYRLPLLKTKENYGPLFEWASEYHSYYTIYLNSYSMKKRSYKMLYSVNSSLTKMGLKICQEMSINTGKEFFYYLGDSNKPAIGIGKQKKTPLKEEGIFMYKWHEFVFS
jgi:predicted  nucleic acid-binding Zn ribbon protein